jgi:hypothetical protein
VAAILENSSRSRIRWSAMEALNSAYDSASGSSDGGDNKEDASEETSASAKRQKFVGPLPATHSAPAPAAAVALLPSPSAPSFTSTENVGGGLDLKYLFHSAGLKTTELIKAKLMIAFSFKDICLKMILCFPLVSCKSVVAIKDVSQNIAALRILFVSCNLLQSNICPQTLLSSVTLFPANLLLLSKIWLKPLLLCILLLAVCFLQFVAIKDLSQTLSLVYFCFLQFVANQRSVSNIIAL